LLSSYPIIRTFRSVDKVELTWLPRLLPTRWLDWVRFKLFGLPRKFGSQADSYQSGHP